MKDDIDKLFARMKPEAGPPDLADRVIRTVFERERRRQQKLIAAIYAAMVASLAFIFWTIQVMVQDFSTSPVFALARLLISDFGAVRENLYNWGLAMIESISLDSLLLPIFGIFIFIILVNKLVGLSREYHRAPKKWPRGISHSVMG